MGVGVGVSVVLGAIGVSEATGTAINWVYVVGGGTVAGSAGAIGTGAGGCMTWNVGCSDSSVVSGTGTFAGSDGSDGDAERGTGETVGTMTGKPSGTATDASTDSTCIIFEQYKYLKLKINCLIDHLIIELIFSCFLLLNKQRNTIKRYEKKRDRYLF